MSDNEPQHPIRPELARAQASEYLGFMGSVIFDLGDGNTWELPNPSFMDPDMKMRWLEHLKFMSEDLDTETTRRKNPITGETETTKRQLYPLRHKRVLINEEELLCKALMGDDVYAQFLAAGGRPGQVQVHWQVMQRQLQERLQIDSKSQ